LVVTSLIAIPAFIFLTVGIDIGLLVIPFCKNDPNMQCGGGGFQYILTMGAVSIAFVGITALTIIRAFKNKNQSNQLS
jgi:hypothetical protein